MCSGYNGIWKIRKGCKAKLGPTGSRAQLELQWIPLWECQNLEIYRNGMQEKKNRQFWPL